MQWGLLCAFGVNLDDTGLQCGEMAARALKGEDITTIKAEYPRNTLVALNRQTADAMGIIFSPDVLNLANVIYHDWEGKNVTRKKRVAISRSAAQSPRCVERRRTPANSANETLPIGANDHEGDTGFTT